MKLRSFLFLIAPLILPMAASAATVQPGDLIKGPMDTVYYYAANNKRYVFPTAQTFFTWFTDFTSVKTLTTDELAAIPFGGNITYRPGVRLVKVTTDPKVYAVSSNGTLRWIKTETIASALYGSNWNKQIDDLPDVYFSNYLPGAPIENISDFSPTIQTSTAATIDINQHIQALPLPPSNTTSTPPTASPSSTASTLPDIQFTASQTIAQPGDTITYTAKYSDPLGAGNVEFFFDGQLINTCALSMSCSTTYPIPQSGTKGSYQAMVRVTRSNTQTITKTLDIPIQTDGAALVSITIPQTIIRPDQLAAVTVVADAKIDVRNIQISVGGAFVKGFYIDGLRAAKWSDYLDTPTIGKVYNVYGIITDALGRTYTSKTLTITIAENDAPSTTLEVGKKTLFTGEVVDLKLTATDSNGIGSTELWVDGVLLKRCDQSVQCTANAGPWPTARTVQIIGKATDTKGQSVQSDPISVTVTMPQ